MTLFRNRATVVWACFVVATIVSWWLGTHRGASAALGVSVLGIGCLKGRYVGLEFMELRHAPVQLRIIFECWMALVFVLLSTYFVLA